jgi:glucokinase
MDRAAEASQEGVQDLPGEAKVLTVDVGATKTALAVFAGPEAARQPEASARVASADWDDLVPLVRSFLDENGLRVEQAAVGVPGPVTAGEARLTNLPWCVSERRLGEELGIDSVALVNDVEAIAQGIPGLRPGQDLATVRSGVPEPCGTIGVVAPGTGLGEAFLTWDGGGYRAHPSEGGHTDFAPANDLQRELLEQLTRRHGHVSYERVASGSAVPDLYEFLLDSGRGNEPPERAERLRAADDRTAAIFEEAAHGDGACRLAVELFVEVLGAEVGNVALTLYATGGVYLAGGIPRRIVPLLRGPRFLDAVRDKGRLASSELLERLAIHVVTQKRTAAIGLARVARRRAAHGDRRHAATR